jgi:hypothetical protein
MDISKRRNLRFRPARMSVTPRFRHPNSVLEVNMVSSSNGRTRGFHPTNRGSIPLEITNGFLAQLAEQRVLTKCQIARMGATRSRFKSERTHQKFLEIPSREHFGSDAHVGSSACLVNKFTQVRFLSEPPDAEVFQQQDAPQPRRRCGWESRPSAPYPYPFSTRAELKARTAHEARHTGARAFHAPGFTCSQLSSNG